MSTTATTKQPNVRWSQKVANIVTLAAGNVMAANIFGGLTLHQIGLKYGLNDEDIRVVTSTNPNNGQKIKQLAIKIDGVTYVVPFSRSFPFDKLNDAEYLLNCKFRGGFMSMKDDDGAPRIDDNGNTVLDTTKPYLSFGKPEGIVIDDASDLFAPLTEEDKARILAGG